MIRTWLRRSARFAALATALTLLPTAAFADDGGSLRLRIDSDKGDRVDLDLSLGWLATFADWVDFECEADTDADTRRMARALDRQGEGGRYEFVDDDGDEVVARRVDGALKIESEDDDGEIARVEMPWPLAECLFLGREPKGGIGKALSNAKFRVKVEDGDGGRVSIDVD